MTNPIPSGLGRKEDPELSVGSAIKRVSTDEFLAPELGVDSKCFVCWGQAPLGPSKLVFIYSSHNCIYLLLEISR